MAMSFDQMKTQEEMMRQRYWLEEQRRMMNSSAYYDENRNAFLAPRSQEAVKEAPKLVPPRATDPLAFMENQANKVLLIQGEI
jgi:hypothetical protein